MTLRPTSLSAVQRCELLLFIAAFFAFAYFNQGGGWNQNARFAEVRAIVEQGRFAVNDFLVYLRAPDSEELVRRPVVDATYEWQGRLHRLCWVDMEWNLTPVGDHPLEDAQKTAMLEKICSGDIVYVPESREFHHNKPPGTSLFAVPGYFLIFHIERLLGVDPDHWWVLNMNVWLTGVFSVGLCAAIGTVLFFRLAREFAGGAVLPALCATLAFAFGTTFFPFATIFFDHSLTAALLIATLYLLRRAHQGGRGALGVLAGLCAGFAVLTNYVAVGAVALLGLYALFARRQESATVWWRRLDWPTTLRFVAGGIGPAIILLAYGYICYGSPFRPSTDFQNPVFRESGAFLGMFKLPTNAQEFTQLQWVARALIYSPFRGVFWFCPVLLLSLWGLAAWAWRWRLLPEALLCGGIFLFFFLVNLFFNGFHAGFSAGPRYLVPAMPFLALPLVVPFSKRLGFLLGSGLGLLSVAIQLVLTATDAQNPVGIGGHARVELRPDDANYDLLSEYAVPLFFEGRAWPLLRQQMKVLLDKSEIYWDKQGLNAEARAKSRVYVANQLKEAIERGESSPFLLGAIEGPVSVNPVGAFEGLLNFGNYPALSPQARWASFNVGELLVPQSRWSLLPLLLVTGGLSLWALLLAARAKSLPSTEASTNLRASD